MALPLTWRAGAANPFARPVKMRSILVRYGNHDLRGRAQRGLECAQADGAEGHCWLGATPEVDDAAARIERALERAALGGALRRGEIFGREWTLSHAFEYAADFEGRFLGFVVAGMDLDHQGRDAPAPDHARARGGVDVGRVERASERTSRRVEQRGNGLRFAIVFEARWKRHADIRALVRGIARHGERDFR